MSGARPRMALLGSGEFLEHMDEVDERLLQGRPRRVAVIPTAAAPEGEARLRYWFDLAHRHGRRLEAEVVEVPAVDRLAADDDELAERVSGAGLIYLSGGNPGFLADTLRDTRLWEAVLTAFERGAALAGCSAGAMALTGVAPDTRQWHEQFRPGLALLPHLAVIPHFDQIPRWVPGIVERYLDHSPRHTTVVGIDEDTALVGGPHEWEVVGRGSVVVLERHGRHTRYTASESVVLEANE